MYPLVIQHSNKKRIMNSCLSYSKRCLSIAMFVYQRVHGVFSNSCSFSMILWYSLAWLEHPIEQLGDEYHYTYTLLSCLAV